MATRSPEGGASKVNSPKPSSTADEEAPPPPAEDSTPKKRGRKRRGEGEDVNLKKKRKEQTTSSVERPSRERKSVERYAALSPRKISSTKVLKIQQGPGEKLKDIPNVVFRFSRKKADESLRNLHAILFGRKANVHFLKRNILQFSGFVWSQNEDKGRSKVREKLNKCNKDRLLEFCDLLDVYSLKATTRKEEISAKLVEFLESPHVTREVILSEKDKKGKKRRRGAKGTGGKALGEASSDKEKVFRLKRGLKGEAKKGHCKPSEDNQDLGNGDSINTDVDSLDEDKNDNAEETSERSDKSESDEENVHDEPQSAKKLSDGEEMIDHRKPESEEKSLVRKKFSGKQSRKSPASFRKKANVDDDAKVSSKKRVEKVAGEKDFMDNAKGKASKKKGEARSTLGSSNISEKDDAKKGKKKIETVSEDSTPGSSNISEKDDKKEGNKKIETASEDTKGSKKHVAKMVSKDKAKNQGNHKVVSAGPNKGQLCAVLSEILKEVDFNVATLADIIRQLGAHFHTDLMHRKAEIKGILEELMNNMTDVEDDEGDGAGAEVGEKD